MCPVRLKGSVSSRKNGSFWSSLFIISIYGDLVGSANTIENSFFLSPFPSRPPREEKYSQNFDHEKEPKLPVLKNSLSLSSKWYVECRWNYLPIWLVVFERRKVFYYHGLSHWLYLSQRQPQALKFILGILYFGRLLGSGFDNTAPLDTVSWKQHLQTAGRILQNGGYIG